MENNKKATVIIAVKNNGFTLNHDLYIYDSSAGNIIYKETGRMDRLVKNIFNYLRDYNVQKINLYGNKEYLSKYVTLMNYEYKLEKDFIKIIDN